MTSHAVKLKVIAGVPKDCSFWLEDDGWNGVCEELALTVRGSSFEDAKRKWKRHHRRTLRVSCESIPQRGGRGLPDEYQNRPVIRLDLEAPNKFDG
jgi:hypothetical protein